MNNKYEITGQSISIEFNGEHFRLFRIRALKDIVCNYEGEIVCYAKAGDLGGFIQNEDNLSIEGACWVAENARVFDLAKVTENAVIMGSAFAYGSAHISEYAQVYGEAEIGDMGSVGGKAEVGGQVSILDNSIVGQNATVYDTVEVSGHAVINGNAKVCGNSEISDYAYITGNAVVRGSIIKGNTRIFENASIIGEDVVVGLKREEHVGIQKLKPISIHGDAKVGGTACIGHNVEIYDNATVTGNCMIGEVPYEEAYLGCDIKYPDKKDWNGVKIFGNATISGEASIQDEAIIKDNAIVSDKAIVYESVKVIGNSKVTGDMKLCGSQEFSEQFGESYPIHFKKDIIINGESTNGKPSENELRILLAAKQLVRKYSNYDLTNVPQFRRLIYADEREFNETNLF